MVHDLGVAAVRVRGSSKRGGHSGWMLCCRMNLPQLCCSSFNEAETARITVEGHVGRPWNLWKQQAAA